MNAQQLRELLAQHDTAMRALLDANPEGLDDAQSQKYDDLEKAYDDTRAKLDQAVARDAKAQEREKFLATAQRAPLVAGIKNQDEQGDDKNDNYRNAFWTAQKREPLSSTQVRALSVGEAEKGGYLVPEEFQTTIINLLTEKSYMRPLATVSSSSSTSNIPVEGADIACGRLDEGEAYPVGDVGISRVIMKAWKMGVTIKVTRELLQDSFTSIEAYISMKFSKSVIKAEEKAIVLGDGIKGAKGFLLDAQLGKTSASTSAITSDEIIDLWGSLDEDYAANAVWKMNRNTLVMLMKLKDAQGDYLVNKGLGGAPSTLLGRPIVVNKYMPNVSASSKPISFGDMSYYFIKDRKMMNMLRLDELYAATGHVGFQIDKRVDGKLVLPEAVKVLQMAAS